MRYGLNFGFHGGTAEDNDTNCFSPLEQTGDSLHGTLLPDTTSDGTLINPLTINVTTGAFVMGFGVAGDEQLYQDEAETIPVRKLIFAYSSDNLQLNWNSTNENYDGTNLSLATALQTEVGNNVCFSAIAIPDVLVWFGFSTMEVQA